MSKYARIIDIEKLLYRKGFCIGKTPDELYEALSDLPTIEVGEGCISREYIKTLFENNLTGTCKDVVVHTIANAPSVVPKQVTGKLADDVTARGTEDIGVKATEKSKLVPSRAEGEWELASDNDGEYGICSLCGSDADFTHYGKPYHYCPNCGAKMK